MSNEIKHELIDHLHSIEAIKLLKNRYFRSIDRCLFDEVAECFSKDAVVDYGPAGVYESPEEFIAMISEYAKTNTATGVHEGSNPEIEVKGDTAVAKWLCHYWSVDAENGISHKGISSYEDEFVRIDGKWLIKKTINRPWIHETFSVEGGAVEMTSLG